MIGNIVINAVVAILSTYIILEFFQIFFEWEKNHKSNKLIISLYCILQFLSLQVFGDMAVWFRLTISLLLVLIISYCFQGDFSERAVFSIIYNAIWMLGELLTGSIFLVIGLPIEKTENIESVLSNVLLLLLMKALQRFFNHESVLSRKGNVLLLLLPIGSMFFTYHLFMLCYKSGTLRDKIVSLVAFASILAVNIIMFIIYIKLSESLELKRKNSIFQLEIALYDEHIKERENAMIEFKKSRHDLKNRLIFLLELLKDKKMDEAQSYVEDLIDLKSLDKLAIANSGNLLIDALINYKYETAMQYAIDFQVRLDIPDDFPLANSDLCVILGNALDNAIEANISPDILKPYINLKMKYDQGNLVIIIENSFDGIVKRDVKGNIISKKQNRIDHGIGVISIQNAVIKYNGYMHTEITDKIYKVIIVMHSSE